MAGAATVMLECDDLAATLDAAARLGALLAAGDCVELRGELGAGKTTFTKGLCASRGVAAELVTSPSFTILNHYRDADGIEIVHADGFRLRGDLEAETLGLEETRDSIFVVEWPDRLSAVLPDARLRIRLLPAEDAEARMLRVGSVGLRGSQLADAWLESLVGRVGVRIAKGGPDGQEGDGWQAPHEVD